MAPTASLIAAVALFAATVVPQLAQGLAACVDNSDCAALEDSVCSAGECVCLDEYFPNSEYTRCLPPSVDSSSSCEAATQCASRLGLGVVCRDSVCSCGPGTHYLHGSCHQSAGLGEPCTESDDCFDNHATHTLTCASGTCACADGAYNHYGVCRLKATGENDACDYDEDCSEADPSLKCAENVCQKKTDRASEASVMTNTYVDSEGDDEETRSVYLSNTTCAQDADCDAGETCSVLKTCACQPGYFRDSDGACKLELGEKCASDADCSHITEARCGQTDTSRDATCHCGSRWAPDPVNNFCRLARKMDYSCAVSANCFGFGNGASCKDYKCACDDGFRFVEERNFCWPIKVLGEECTENFDCYYDNSICSEGVCGCAAGYHVTTKDTCTKDVTALGDACVDYADCSEALEHSLCSGGRCKCSNTYVQTGPTVCSVGVGHSCTDNESCSAVSGAFCNGKKCACEEGFTLSAASDACLEVATEEGAPCVDSVQCEPLMGANSTCNAVTASCACVAGQHFADGACWPKIALGATCGRSSECFVAGSRSGVECRNGVCECKFYHVATGDGACVSGATSDLRVGASMSALLLLAVSLLRSSLW